MGLSLSDYVVTEAGFGFDLGAEKFLDIKCQSAGLAPSAVVIVATIRALKYHGGKDLKTLAEPDVDALLRGVCNLDKHLDSAQAFGLPAVVAINRFPGDSQPEIDALLQYCAAIQTPAFDCDIWARGGAGGRSYRWDEPVETKIARIATRIYGADGVTYAPKAQADLRKIERLGLQDLPVCIAKTQKSLSDNPERRGRPQGFDITVREIEIAAGARFLIPITGDIMRMPGLPEHPAAETIDIDAEGNISGLF
jgi:formate--tetrahydrofolate ligase